MSVMAVIACSIVFSTAAQKGALEGTRFYSSHRDPDGNNGHKASWLTDSLA